MSTHIINVAFDFDDEKVRQTLEKSAEGEILKSIKKDVSEVVSNRSSMYNSYSEKERYKDGLRNIVKESIDSMLEDYMDKIIESAADRLAERLCKTKAAKELLKKTAEEVQNGNGGEDDKVQ